MTTPEEMNEQKCVEAAAHLNKKYPSLHKPKPVSRWVWEGREIGWTMDIDDCLYSYSDKRLDNLTTVSHDKVRVKMRIWVTLIHGFKKWELLIRNL